MGTTVKNAELIQNLPRIGRKWRRPKYRFQLQTRPYQVQPFLISPVLPGDTLKAGMFQSRVITDPIKNALTGWHQEYYFFYVKLMDLEIRDTIPELFMTEGYDASALTRAANLKTYHPGGGVDWVYECLRRVTAEYFRSEGEAWDVAMLDGLPIAKAFTNEDNWTDSLIQDDDAPETVDAEDETGQMYGEEYAKWSHMQQLKLTALTFPEYLQRVYGVVTESAKVESHRPELLRYVRSWSYPSNTIDATTGTPSSAVSWSVQERLDKGRYFKEPGFVFGVTVSRPKVYMSKQVGSGVSLLTNGERWLPSIVLANEPHQSLVNVPLGTGPLPSMTDDGGYWVDLMDLFLYGEQFINFDPTTAGKAMVSLPTVTGSIKYPTSADIDALFVAPAANTVRQDGIVDFRFLSRLTDTTK